MNKIKSLAFAIVFVFCCIGVNILMKPVSIQGARHSETCREFYSLPKNSVETIIVGASITVHGISPIQIYKEHGLSVYNLGIPLQTLLSSSEWIYEAYKRNPDFLKNVILETSTIGWPDDKGKDAATFTELKMSLNKLDAIKDTTSNLDDFLAEVFPTIAYHTRWKELNKTDILNADSDENYFGYFFSTANVFDDLEFDKIPIIGFDLDPEATHEVSEYKMHCMDDIISFCKEKGINLIFYTTPRSDWTSGMHNKMQSIADESGFDYIDFNFGEPWEALGFNMASDVYDNRHPNHYGAEKLTRYIGNYLAENCETTDVRGDPKFDFIAKEEEDYDRGTIKSKLDDCQNPVDYLNVVSKVEDATVLIAVKGDAAKCLRDDQREGFRELGLEKLADIGYQDAYVGIIEDGKVIYEEAVKISEATVIMPEMRQPLIYETKAGKNTVLLKSGGALQGSVVAIEVNNSERSWNSGGINVVVWDKRSENVIGKAGFNTGITPERQALHLEKALNDLLEAGREPSKLPNNLKALYLYNVRVSDAKKAYEVHKEIGEQDVLKYIDSFTSPTHTIFIGMSANADYTLTPETREGLKARGLVMLSESEALDNYVGVMNNGSVTFDKLGKNGESVSVKLFDDLIRSTDSGVTIKYKGNQVGLKKNGLEIVVCNSETGLVSDRVCFVNGRSPILK